METGAPRVATPIGPVTKPRDDDPKTDPLRSCRLPVTGDDDTMLAGDRTIAVREPSPRGPGVLFAVLILAILTGIATGLGFLLLSRPKSPAPAKPAVAASYPAPPTSVGAAAPAPPDLARWLASDLVPNVNKAIVIQRKQEARIAELEAKLADQQKQIDGLKAALDGRPAAPTPVRGSVSPEGRTDSPPVSPATATTVRSVKGIMNVYVALAIGILLVFVVVLFIRRRHAKNDGAAEDDPVGEPNL